MNFYFIARVGISKGLVKSPISRSRKKAPNRFRHYLVKALQVNCNKSGVALKIVGKEYPKRDMWQLVALTNKLLCCKKSLLAKIWVCI